MYFLIWQWWLVVNNFIFNCFPFTFSSIFISPAFSIQLEHPPTSVTCVSDVASIFFESWLYKELCPGLSERLSSLKIRYFWFDCNIFISCSFFPGFICYSKHLLILNFIILRFWHPGNIHYLKVFGKFAICIIAEKDCCFQSQISNVVMILHWLSLPDIEMTILT